jgi:hypothetical protein
VRGCERVEERVEVEQLLHVASAQDKHLGPDGTPRSLPRASLCEGKSEFWLT